MPQAPLSILLIEDTRADVLRFRHSVATGMPDATIDVVSTLEAGKRAVNGHDIVVLDLHLPDSMGIETLREMRKHTRKPLIVYTANCATNECLEYLDAGADDIIPKLTGSDQNWLKLSVVKSLYTAQRRGNVRDEIHRRLTDLAAKSLAKLQTT